MTRRESYIKDTSAPIAVHDDEDISLYHTLDEATKVAWNRMAQDAADEFDKTCDSYDSTRSYHRWAPCNFRKWVKENLGPSDAYVEKVARAICEVTSGPYEMMSDRGKDALRLEAKAAIAVFD